MDDVILVDEHDVPLGTFDKLAAHRKGLLHRAFSVFIFRSDGCMLLQQRAFAKYHSGGLWTNACCSHPRPNEEVLEAAHRRLQEELGIECELQPAGALLYRAEVGNGLIEHEYDHLLIGVTDLEPLINHDEVAAVAEVPMPELLSDVALHPNRYTYWFREALPKVVQAFNKTVY